jgi:hypothetical protein
MRYLRLNKIYAKGEQMTIRQRIILEVDEQDVMIIEECLNKLDVTKFSGTLTITYDPPLNLCPEQKT